MDKVVTMLLPFYQKSTGSQRPQSEPLPRRNNLTLNFDNPCACVCECAKKRGCLYRYPQQLVSVLSYFSLINFPVQFKYIYDGLTQKQLNIYITIIKITQHHTSKDDSTEQQRGSRKSKENKLAYNYL